MEHPHLTIMPRPPDFLEQWSTSPAKDDPRLKRLLAKMQGSDGEPMSKEQHRRQMISWVYGQLPARLGISMEEVEEHFKDRL